MKRQGGQLQLTTRATYGSDMNTGQTVVPNSQLLVTDAVRQRLSMVLGCKIDGWPRGSGLALNWTD